ncbi:MAG: hypothetical protein IT342_23460 [Candidatus Melainabacteria bacterium]|nr:hypothetical protein [Candidatus Melainabacteria bacterium]
MQSVNWQLVVAGEPVQPGTRVRVREKWQNSAGAHVVLQQPQSDRSSTFCVRFNVNIGGKNYLLLEDASAPAGDLTIVRLFPPDNFGAMDPDRLSSLRNALIDFLQSELPANLEELEKLLGGLEAR